jgi:hypothetical protein
MPQQDVPQEIFLGQISNPTIRNVLTGTSSLPDSISPSALIFSLVDALFRAQTLFNAEDTTVPDISTVSGRELGPIATTPDGTLQTQVFYTVGGTLQFDPGNINPIVA